MSNAIVAMFSRTKACRRNTTSDVERSNRLLVLSVTEKEMKRSITKLRGRRRSPPNDDLVRRIWGIPPNHGHGHDDPRLDAYHDHYSSLTLLASTLGLSNREQVVELINLVRDRKTQSTHDILDAIKVAGLQWRKPAFTTNEALEALQFTLRLWLFSSPKLDQSSSTLEDLIKTTYTPAATSTPTQPPSQNGLLSSDFCAKSLTRKAGFYLVWTSDLCEHLTFASKDQLRIFRHAHILQQYQRQTESTLFPPHFLAETHRTLHLLFPIEDLKTSRRVKRLSRREHVDIEAAASTATTIEKSMMEHQRFQLASYVYYGARLAEIQRRYDLARPKRMAQWWYDRRQRPEWAALMVALVVFMLTVIFGIAQTVTGILQVVVSWHSN